MRELGVLVVDCDSEILSNIERMFGYFKVKVDCVMSATEALDSLKAKDYRIMISYLGLPGMNGRELAGLAHKQNPALNILLFTGNTSEQVLNLAMDPKVSDISEVCFKRCGLGDMLIAIMKRETGRTFLLE